MESSPVARKLNPSDLPLDRLVSNRGLSEKEKLAGISHHFEAILLRQFLNDAQKPLLKSKGAMLGASHDIYQDMIVNQLAEAISKTGTFGLANSFQAQMTHPHKVDGQTADRDAPKQ
ncbi:MAG: rod-binding protein [Verrucomicrobia bacterium]|nr:rod-binding protein [Verrucomicrobiota bacterium]